MTDDRSPDTPIPDDELPTGAFDGLDLDSLTTGVHAGADQWSSIATAASRRRHRRAWVVAAAALVVLLVATAAVVLDRDDNTDQVDVASGAVDDGGVQHLLPPVDAADVTVSTRENGVTISYLSRESEFALGQFRPVPTATSLPATPDELAAAAEQSGGTPVDVPGRGRIWVWCPTDFEGSGPDGTVVSSASPVGARWIDDGVVFQLIRYPGGNLTCDEQVSNMAERVAELVPVDAAGWRAFLADHLPRNSPHTSVDTVDPSTTTSTTSTTTSTDATSAEQGTPEQQIAAAVKGLMDRDADGSYPSLEDGSSRAGEYKAMFDLAATQSGADQVADPQEGPFALTNTTFTAPDRATITFDAAAHLPSGEYHFDIPGTALLQDGRWVISYDTIATMVGRACTPPGGVSTACGAHR